MGSKQLMSWPEQSADLNPIEMEWDELKHKIRAKQPTSWQLLQKSWAELFSVYLQCLVVIMPKICEIVIVVQNGVSF